MEIKNGFLNIYLFKNSVPMSLEMKVFLGIIIIVTLVVIGYGIYPSVFGTSTNASNIVLHQHQ